MKTDFIIENHGSIFLLRPETEEARGWVEEHIPDDAMQFGGAVAVEHRFIGDIADGILNDGLTVRGL